MTKKFSQYISVNTQEKNGYIHIILICLLSQWKEIFVFEIKKANERQKLMSNEHWMLAASSLAVYVGLRRLSMCHIENRVFQAICAKNYY